MILFQLFMSLHVSVFRDRSVSANCKHIIHICASILAVINGLPLNKFWEELIIYLPLVGHNAENY
jgi:hypothetical protein